MKKRELINALVGVSDNTDIMIEVGERECDKTQFAKAHLAGSDLFEYFEPAELYVRTILDGGDAQFCRIIVNPICDLVNDIKEWAKRFEKNYTGRRPSDQEIIDFV